MNRLAPVALILVIPFNALADEPPKPADGPLGMKFVKLPKGTFYMGWDSENQKEQRRLRSRPTSRSPVYPVTQEQWQALMGNNPSCFSRTGGGEENSRTSPTRPEAVSGGAVSWKDAQAFIRQLNEKRA